MATGGFVYLIRLADFYKIGQSNNPAKRFLAFAQLPFQTKLIHFFPSRNALEVEKAIHLRFEDKRVRGEWFALVPEDVTLILSVDRCDSPEELPETLRPCLERLRSRASYGCTIRLNDAAQELLYPLLETMRAVLGMPNLSQADVLHAALAELERRYPEGCEAGTAPPLPVERTRRGPAPTRPQLEPRARARPREKD